MAGVDAAALHTKIHSGGWLILSMLLREALPKWSDAMIDIALHHAVYYSIALALYTIMHLYDYIACVLGATHS